jgi:hypothetical protein
MKNWKQTPPYEAQKWLQLHNYKSGGNFGIIQIETVKQRSQ